MSATVTTIPTSLRDRAQLAWVMAEAEDARAAAEHRAERLATLTHRLHDGLRDTLGFTTAELDPIPVGVLEVESADPDYDSEELPILTIEGLVFTPWLSWNGHRGSVGLVKQCPKCERFVPVVVVGLAELDRAITTPLAHDRCPADSLAKAIRTATSPNARLIQALTDFITDVAVQLQEGR